MKCSIHKTEYEELWTGCYLCEKCFVDDQMSFEGQIPSGKNAVNITRTGHRYPNKRFTEWRKTVINKVPGKDITEPVSVLVKYWPGDKRRRDVPGMIDALWHVLEKARYVEDDKFLGGEDCILVFKNMGLDRDNPRVELKISFRKK